MLAVIKKNSLKSKIYIQRANGKIDSVVRGRFKRAHAGDTIFVPVNPDPQDFDITTFLADFSGTLASLATIIFIINNSSDSN